MREKGKPSAAIAGERYATHKTRPRAVRTGPLIMAERQGFEPWVRKRTTVFEFDEYRFTLSWIILKRPVLCGVIGIGGRFHSALSGAVLSSSLANRFATVRGFNNLSAASLQHRHILETSIHFALQSLVCFYWVGRDMEWLQ